MFHGAKVWSPEYGNRARDIKLLKAALVILKQSASINHEVLRAYEIGVF